jgi:hypothetical protein
MVMLRFWQNKEKETKEKSRGLIEDIYKAVQLIDEKAIAIDSRLTQHERSTHEIIQKIFEKLEAYKCPHDDDMALMKAYNKKQNGHIDDISVQGQEIKTKLDIIIAESVGEEKAKKEIIAETKRLDEKARDKKAFIIALISCMLVGITTFSGFFFWYKKDNRITKAEIKEMILELKPLSGGIVRGKR